MITYQSIATQTLLVYNKGINQGHFPINHTDVLLKF